MYPTISTDYLLNIPLSTDRIHSSVNPKKVRESCKARRQFKQLLEIAKIGVEQVIAMAWINQQLETLGINPSETILE